MDFDVDNYLKTGNLRPSKSNKTLEELELVAYSKDRWNKQSDNYIDLKITIEHNRFGKDKIYFDDRLRYKEIDDDKRPITSLDLITAINHHEIEDNLYNKIERICLSRNLNKERMAHRILNAAKEELGIYDALTGYFNVSKDDIKEFNNDVVMYVAIYDRKSPGGFKHIHDDFIAEDYILE